MPNHELHQSHTTSIEEIMFSYKGTGDEKEILLLPATAATLPWSICPDLKENLISIYQISRGATYHQ
jgi:hypothetical protein